MWTALQLQGRRGFTRQPRTPNVHIRGKRRFKHHQNSRRGQPRETKRATVGAGEGKKSEILGGPAQEGSAGGSVAGGNRRVHNTSQHITTHHNTSHHTHHTHHTHHITHTSHTHHTHITHNTHNTQQQHTLQHTHDNITENGLAQNG